MKSIRLGGLIVAVMMLTACGNQKNADLSTGAELRGRTVVTGIAIDPSFSVKSRGNTIADAFVYAPLLGPSGTPGVDGGFQSDHSSFTSAGVKLPTAALMDGIKQLLQASSGTRFSPDTYLLQTADDLKKHQPYFAQYDWLLTVRFVNWGLDSTSLLEDQYAVFALAEVVLADPRTTGTKQKIRNIYCGLRSPGYSFDTLQANHAAVVKQELEKFMPNCLVRVREALYGK